MFIEPVTAYSDIAADCAVTLVAEWSQANAKE